MCIRAGCKTKRIEQVCFCIGYFHGNWFLGTGDDNRLRRVLNQVGQCRRGVCHGIGSVADDKAIIFFIVILNGAGHQKPIFRLDVGRVNVENLNCVNGTKFARCRYIVQQFFRGNLWSKTIFGVFRRDRSTGRNQQNVFHNVSSLPILSFFKKILC